MYEFKTEQFSGPIEKLLELIEARKLPITEVSLADITADFLGFLETLEKENDGTFDSRILADFLVVAASLLLIKSKALLPGLLLSPEEEESVANLEERLKAYQLFKPAITLLKRVWEKNNPAFSRPLFFGLPPVFQPSDNLTLENLVSVIQKLEEITKPAVLEKTAVAKTIISLEEKISDIINRLNETRGKRGFKEFIRNRSRQEMVAAFLAVLHLIERRKISAEQKDGFSDIIISKSE